MQRKGRLVGELLLDSVAVSQFCSDSPSLGGRGWRWLLVPLLFGGSTPSGAAESRVSEGGSVCFRELGASPGSSG